MSLYKTTIMKNEKSFVELKRAQPLDPTDICINTSSNAVFILYIITHIKLQLLKMKYDLGEGQGYIFFILQIESQVKILSELFLLVTKENFSNFLYLKITLIHKLTLT